jgi:omega-amidase
MSLPPSLAVALGEYDTGWHEPVASLARATSLISSSAATGARLVVLPEMCATGFTMDSSRWAEAPRGDSARALAETARRHDIYVLAGLATTRSGKRYNSALLFGPDGRLASAYDKRRRFGFAGEDSAYDPGSTSVTVEVDGLRLSIFICYDLRFPELFREVGPYVDAIALVANWPASRMRHWETLVRARAIENQCYVIAVNRLGTADDLDYIGGSLVCDPWGDNAPTTDHDGVRIATVSASEVSRVRERFPFSPDRRSAAVPFGPFASDWRAIAGDESAESLATVGRSR